MIPMIIAFVAAYVATVLALTGYFLKVIRDIDGAYCEYAQKFHEFAGIIKPYLPADPPTSIQTANAYLMATSYRMHLVLEKAKKLRRDSTSVMLMGGSDDPTGQPRIQ